MPCFDAALLRAWDAWLLTLLVVVALPVHGYFGLYRPMAKAHGDAPGFSRIRLYASISGPQWALAGVLLWVLKRHHLGLASVGLSFHHPARLLGVTLALVAGWWGLAYQGYRRSLQVPRDRLLAQMARSRFIVPATPMETLGFLGLALTTGFCEELLFRGWVVPFLGALGGSLLLGVGATGLLFGLGHAHQGAKGILQTGLIGIAMGFGYWALGSLIPLQALHMAINFSQGLLAARLLARMR